MLSKFFTRPSHKCVACLAAVSAIAFCCATVQAQSAFRGLNAQRDAVLGTGGGGGGGGGNSGRSNSGPSPAQAAAQQRQATATTQNNQGVDAFEKQDWATAEADFKKSIETVPNDPVVLRNLACTQDHEACDAYKKGDYASALTYMQQAVASDPASDTKDNEAIRKDLAFIQGVIADAQARQQQDKIAANNMQQSIQDLAKSLSAAPTSGGLDFDGGNSGNTPKAGAKSDGLDFMPVVSNDPMVVDARHVPSGLPKSVDEAIVAALPNAPPGVSDRVRKGFEAIANHDWKVAKAWFGDALNHDPGNAGLQRLMDLADYTEKRQAATPASPKGGDVNVSPPVAAAKAPVPGMEKLDSALEAKMDEDLARQLDDFNKNYLPKHPELMNPAPAPGAQPPANPAAKPAAASQTDAGQNSGYQQLLQWLKPPPLDRSPTSVSGVRG